MTVLAVAGAAAAGAVCRYLLDSAIQRRHRGTLPLGTLVVNVSGSLVLGFVAGLAIHHGLDATPRSIVGAGFLGAYTTFSTFSYDTVRLIEEDAGAVALLNTALSLILGLAAAAAGLAVAAL